MLTLQQTNSSNPDFRDLVIQLDKDLAIRDGEEHSFYHQFNAITHLNHVIVASLNGEAAGCGAFKEYAPGTVEIKRMFVSAEHRGKGIALLVLKNLEQWAASLNYKTCILETGKKQPEAISLYLKAGYLIIPNYGQYKDAQNSICMLKTI